MAAPAVGSRKRRHPLLTGGGLADEYDGSAGRAGAYPTGRRRTGDGSSSVGGGSAATGAAAAAAGRSAAAAVPFTHGNITSLKMHNFLTFNDVSLSPGPRLNLIIGPNGSGKSTVVNALCIVFGGHLRLLGRSQDLSQYVRHGQDMAWVEATLYDTQSSPRPRYRTVRRTFYLDSKSEWQIDGARATRSAVDKLRAEFDIQLDNLCQFLPQERIAQFTELRPAELLASTMAALGGSAMTNRHGKLIKDYADLALTDQSGASDAKSLADLEAQNAAIEGEVSSYTEREKLREKIDDLNAYRPWVHYDDVREEARNMRKPRDEAAEAAKVAEEKLHKAEEPIKKLRTDIAAREKAVVDAKKTVAAADRTAGRLMPEVEKMADKVRAQAAARTQLEDKAAQLATRVAKAKQALDKAEADAAQTRPPEELNAAVHAAIGRRTEVRQADTAMQAKVAEWSRRRNDASAAVVDLQRSISALADVRKQALTQLCREPGNRDVLFCWEWIQKNRDRFEEPVFGPIGIELTVAEQYHGRILEAAVPAWMRGTFVTQTPADNRLLLDELKRKHHKTVNAINVMPTTGPFFPARPISSLRHFGFTCWASDIYQAPDPVRRALQSQVALHMWAVGTADTERVKDQVLASAGLSRFYTPTNWYAIIGSRYDPTARTTRINQLRPGRGLYGGARDDGGELAMLRSRSAEASADVAAAETKLNELSAEAQTIKATLTAAESATNAARRALADAGKLREMLKMERRRYGEASRAAAQADVEGERSRSFQESKRLRAKLLTAIAEEVNVVSTMAERMRAVDALSAEVANLGLQLELEMRGNAAQRREVKRLQTASQQILDDFNAKVREVRELRIAAVAAVPDPQVVRVRLGLTQLPQYMDELEDQIAALQAQADLIVGTSRQVVDEFERRRKRIATLRTRLETTAAQTTSRRAVLDERRDTFVTTLKAAVDHMSVRFSELYTQLGCSGELNLVRTDDLNEMYVEILVRYREATELRALSGQTHSGGERMVATMLYHFALQEQTPAPFRVVDEMNQGMDAHFERAILSMMIADARRPGSPQCLLITPKLLLDLEFNAHAVTHMIFNGEVNAQV